MKITFTGYNKPEILTNFPILLRLSDNVNGSGFSYNQFASTLGNDLRFTASNQTTELPYEIEKWDTNGTSYVWVRVPALINTNSYIYAYWGKTGVSSPSYTTNGAVWTNNFEAVWHMNSLNPADWAKHNNDGTAIGGVTTNSNGRINGALSFDGSTGSITTPDESHFDFTGGFTVEAWAYPTVTLSTYTKGVLDKKQTASSGFALTHYNYYWNFNVSGVACQSPSPFSLNTWYYLAGVNNGTHSRLYVNGQQVAGPSAATLANNNDTLLIARYLGADNHSDRHFTGMLDEVRISRIARSSNWVWACWMNIASSQNFMTYGEVTRLQQGTIFMLR